MEQNLSNKKPLVSIITPTLNSGKFLEKTIQSIASQDYNNIEHIIIDGFSTDNTVKLLKKYEKKYNLRWISEKDRSAAHAFSKGGKMVRGEIMGWCSADDYYTEGAIKKIVGIFVNNSEIDLVFGSCQEFDYKTNKFSIIHRLDPAAVSNITSDDILYGRIALYQPSLFYRKSIIEKTGPLNPKLEAVGEVDWWIRMFKNGAKVFYIDEIIAIIGQHKERISIKHADRGIKECMMLMESYGKRIPLSLRMSYLRWKYPKIPNLIKKHFPYLFLVISKTTKSLCQ